MYIRSTFLFYIMRIEMGNVIKKQKLKNVCISCATGLYVRISCATGLYVCVSCATGLYVCINCAVGFTKEFIQDKIKIQ